MLGISNKLLSSKFILYLCHQGCMPAYYYYRDSQRMSRDKAWRTRVNKVKNTIEKKFSFKINDDPIFSLTEKSKLLKIKKIVLELPMRSLISPFNQNTLNEKLYSFSTADIIGEHKLGISRNSLKKRDTKFTSADINNIRRSIIWLNWFMYDENIMKKSTRPENVNLCLSSDAVNTFAVEGFDGLYNIAKYKKRALKKCFDKFPTEKKSCMSFLSLSSIELDSLVNNRITKTRLENLFRCYDHFVISHKNPIDKRRMPNYYMYNPNILKTQKNLQLLFNFGYQRMQHMKFLDRKNQEIVQNQDVYNLLHKNFSSFKRK